MAPSPSPDDDPRSSPSNGSGGDPPAKKLRPSASITPAEIRAEFSHHDPLYARVNNGSFGCCPRSVVSAMERLQLLNLSQPDAFYFHRLKPLSLRSRSLVRDLIRADHLDEVSLVDNATTAAAIVLQHVQRSIVPGDAVVMLHYAYGSVKRSVHAYLAPAGAHILEVPLPFPLSNPGEILACFRRALAEASDGGRRRVRLAVVDHITSMPSVVIPIRDIVRICREEGVDRVFVDAAHAIGNVEVDVRDIGADFYTSNLHKWLFCPPSVAFLYCRRSPVHGELHHPVVSSEFGKGLAEESAWIGTRDYSAQLVVPEALEFFNRFEGGIEGVQRRNHEKVVEMALMLAEAWGTHLGLPPEMCSSMAMVGMPACLGIGSEKEAMGLRTHLRERFKVEVPIYFRAPAPVGEENGEVPAGACITGYARISHQVYNVVEDYFRLRDAVNKLVEEGFACSMLEIKL